MSLRPRVRVASLVAALALAASLLAPSAALAEPQYSTSITASFGAPRIALGDSTSLTVDITAALPYGYRVAFAYWFPSGLGISNVGGSCTNGTVFGFPLDIEAYGFDLGSGVSCHITATVTGVAAATYNELFQSQGVDTNGNNFEYTDDYIWVPLQVIAPPSTTASFATPAMAPGATDTLTIDIANPSPNSIALTGVGFESTLPSGLTVVSGSASVCGGTLTTTAPTWVTLSGASIAAGSVCHVQVVVTGASNGTYNVPTGSVASTEGGGGTGAWAGVIVATYAPPIITAQFGAGSLQVGGTTSLTFTISNPNAVSNAVVRPAALGPGDLTGVGFTNTLPSGLVVATPNGLTGDCGGGTIAAAAGGQTISLTGATLAAGASCSFSVVVRAVAAGVQENSTGPVGSAQAAPGDPGSAMLTVGNATPPPTTSLPAGPAGPDSRNGLAVALALAFATVLALALMVRRKRVRA